MNLDYAIIAKKINSFFTHFYAINLIEEYEKNKMINLELNFPKTAVCIIKNFLKCIIKIFFV